jgi:hypothetical protein
MKGFASPSTLPWSADTPSSNLAFAPMKNIFRMRQKKQGTSEKLCALYFFQSALYFKICA